MIHRDQLHFKISSNFEKRFAVIMRQHLSFILDFLNVMNRDFTLGNESLGVEVNQCALGFRHLVRRYKSETKVRNKN